VDGLREAIGDTKYTNPKKAYFHALTDAGKVAAWAIRVPFLLIALVGLLIKVIGEVILNVTQKICVMLPGSVD
jgi:hypothetical protein